jgi:HSP20 family protein
MEKIEANYKDGVLHMVLPKKEEALPKPKRLIEIG